ncbi:hypothetical protein ND991_18005 [Gordonia sputi]|uniref:hypothetical protein n=1 Tax=Gordonia sputi TaxID=36823 RepID=UPI002043F16C|nr:hypothetical protein [Gordonia sputi]MCM3897103.1 hypothetical protein [Gordonia sputi]
MAYDEAADAAAAANVTPADLREGAAGLEREASVLEQAAKRRYQDAAGVHGGASYAYILAMETADAHVARAKDLRATAQEFRDAADWYEATRTTGSGTSPRP